MIKYFFLVPALMWALFVCSCRREPFPSINKESKTLENNKSSEREITFQNRTFYIDGSYGKSPDNTKSQGVNLLKRSFIVTKDDGDYHIGVHILPTGKNNEGGIQDVDVVINSQKIGKLNLSKTTWEFATLSDKKTIHLKQGENEISFLSNGIFYPEIDAIQIESDCKNLIFDDPEYNEYLNFLKGSHSANDNEIEQWQIDSLLRSESNQPRTRTAIDFGNSWQVTPYALSNPDGDYIHMVNVPMTYTYHRRLSLSQGNFTFHTGDVNGATAGSVDPIMFLYKIDDPQNFSFVNDNYAGLGRHSKIIANNLPTGDYFLIVRAYSSSFANTSLGRQGIVNVYQNNTLINSDCPVAGYSVSMNSSKTGVMNFFTAYSKGLPAFFLEENASKKIRYNGATNYQLPNMDYTWYGDARVQINQTTSSVTYNMLVMADNAFSAYYGNCDAYGYCTQVSLDNTLTADFPSLKQNDAIYSGTSATYAYNCAAWAGGITNTAIWIGSTGGPYIWPSWDDYFGNNPPRYSGATTYTRDGAKYRNSEIAVWSILGDVNDATHFSARASANNHPHGYAWESKPGALRRMFHPSDALTGPTYGFIVDYYRDEGKAEDIIYTRGTSEEKSISFEESIEKGLTVIEDVDLSLEEKGKILSLSKSMIGMSSIMESLYDRWKEAISKGIHQCLSNPYELSKIREARDIVQFGLSNQTAALLFFSNLYFNENIDSFAEQMSYVIFCEIFHNKADKIEQLKHKWKSNQYNSAGAYIAPLPTVFMKKYVKSLIDELI